LPINLDERRTSDADQCDAGQWIPFDDRHGG
jgi:hypothetical protein